MWASYDFMYTGVTEKKGVDSHTFVHETGHLLGLDDYYNYDDIETRMKRLRPKYRRFAPMGALDMMDYNILDHDIWSKFALGWAYAICGGLLHQVTGDSDIKGFCFLKRRFLDYSFLLAVITAPRLANILWWNSTPPQD
jgi:hypothetical protein